ncbi:Piso0_001364 [Millerozyma farinosa CBS 7064]|uniref:Piso0_001364 protein n=1 Tax=Pichia sorbitophila (strain ATCC MYA-4447 / BCRC 22081 / CBS 7064 / NBRC 10061 / NRRL Y-12695) TaxID=559304 RepID=G8YMZ1_PICSO|nr:Piso0_001364 [Millerozyma farinosa CBS 7064]
MVAEPVQATVDTLSYYYNHTADYLSVKKHEIIESDAFDKLVDLKSYFTGNDSANSKGTGTRGWSDRTLDHLIKYKLRYISIFTIGIGIGAFYFKKPTLTGNGKLLKRRRRVPKMENGARSEVVLIFGSVTEPITRLLALDFEKRGFIVYITIQDEKDLKYIESNNITEDINYLNLCSSQSYEMSINKFRQLLEIPVVPFPGADTHVLNLRAIVFAPSLHFQLGPVENISSASWSKLNDKLSMYFKALSSGLIALARAQNSKLILLVPNIISSLNIPYHSPESIFQNTLKNLFKCLSGELKKQNISVTQIRLGNIHVFNQNPASRSKIQNIVHSEIRSWKEDMKSLYADSFSRSQYRFKPIKSTGKGSSLRDLYHLLFDLIYTNKRNPSVIYFGTGARIYDYIAKFIPESLIEFFYS